MCFYYSNVLSIHALCQLMLALSLNQSEKLEFHIPDSFQFTTFHFDLFQDLSLIVRIPLGRQFCIGHSFICPSGYSSIQFQIIIQSFISHFAVAQLISFIEPYHSCVTLFFFLLNQLNII